LAELRTKITSRMDIAYAPCYVLEVPDGHRFPMQKYRWLREQLVHQGIAEPEAFFTPDAMAEADVLAAHTLAYWTKLRDGTLSRSEQRRSGFSWSPELVTRERVIVQGTLECALRALKSGEVALNIAGGTHHAYPDRAEGFCLLNDFGLAANLLLQRGAIRRALVLDCDVHQGNGTAAMMRHEPRVTTFSMHGAHNYPLHKEVSDCDVALPDGTDDPSYLALLEHHLGRLLNPQALLPDLVFYQCGVDVLASDKLGRLSLTPSGCRERDRMVFTRCAELGIPVVCAMGGGYSPNVHDVVEAHLNTFREALDAWT